MGGTESKTDDTPINEIALEITNQFCGDFVAWHRFYVESDEKVKARFWVSKFEPKALLENHVKGESNNEASLKMIKAGFLTKMGFKVKNWKRRYFILYNRADNFAIHYYADEQCQYEKGVVHLFGYFVRMFNDTEERKYGSHGVVLQHRQEGHRRWLMRADTSREQSEWIQAFTTACNLAVRDATIPKPIMDSFSEAIKTTRSIYGFFGACVPRGRTEEDLLLTLVSNVLRRELFENLNNSATQNANNMLAAGQKSIRASPVAISAAREAQRKAMERIVEPLIKTRWQESLSQALVNGPSLSHALQPSLRQLIEMENQVIAHIDGELGELVQPIALEQYSRIVEPLVSRCLDPLLSAWEKAILGLVRMVLEQMTGSSSIRTLAGDLHDLLSGAQLLQAIGGEGPLAGAALALWRLETEDLGPGLAETFAPSDAIDLTLAEHNHTVRNNLMMNAANVGEELSPEAVTGLAAASQTIGGNIGARDDERPVCDGRLFTAMVFDVIEVAQDFLATVERLLLRPEEAMPLLWTLHEQNMRNLQAMDRVLQANAGGPVYVDEVMAAVSRSFSLAGTAGGHSNTAQPSAGSSGLGEAIWVNDGFRTIRYTVAGSEAEVLGIWDESTNNNSNSNNNSTAEDVHQSRDEEHLHSNWLNDVVPVVFAQMTRLLQLQRDSAAMNAAATHQSSDHAQSHIYDRNNTSNNTAGHVTEPTTTKDICIQALRCSIVLAARDVTGAVRRRLRETATSAMENSMQETLLGTAGDIALDLVSPASDGFALHAVTRPSMYTPKHQQQAVMFNLQEDADEDDDDDDDEDYRGYNTNKNSKNNKHTPANAEKCQQQLQQYSYQRQIPTRLQTDLTQTQVRLLAEQRARELMTRCVDRMLDKAMAEAGRRLRVRLMRLLCEDLALPGTAKALAMSQSYSMAAAIRTVTPTKRRTANTATIQNIQNIQQNKHTAGDA